MLSQISKISNRATVFGAFVTGASMIFHLGRTSDRLDQVITRVDAQEREKETVLSTIQDIRERMISTEKSVMNIEKNIQRIENNVGVIENDVKQILIDDRHHPRSRH
jgi:hypothetical protein